MFTEYALHICIACFDCFWLIWIFEWMNLALWTTTSEIVLNGGDVLICKTDRDCLHIWYVFWVDSILNGINERKTDWDIQPSISDSFSVWPFKTFEVFIHSFLIRWWHSTPLWKYSSTDWNSIQEDNFAWTNFNFSLVYLEHNKKTIIFD